MLPLLLFLHVLVCLREKEIASSIALVRAATTLQLSALNFCLFTEELAVWYSHRYMNRVPSAHTAFSWFYPYFFFSRWSAMFKRERGRGRCFMCMLHIAVSSFYALCNVRLQCGWMYHVFRFLIAVLSQYLDRLKQQQYDIGEECMFTILWFFHIKRGAEITQHSVSTCVWFSRSLR